ncbi:MAG: M56 family metallopeptidase [Blastocatellales bacterium]
MSSMIENFDSLARLLLEALLNTLWQGMLIAALVWLLLRFTKRASATTRHAVWLVTLLTIGALPLVAIVANRNVPAANPASPVKQEMVKPAIQTATPTAAPEANQLAEPFSLDEGIARLNSSAGRNQPRAGQNVRLEPRFLEPVLAESKLAERQFDSAAKITTLEESSSVVPSLAVVSPKTEEKSLWRRAQSRVADAFSGFAPLLLVILWLVVCALMSWRIARSYRAVFRLRKQLGFVPSEQRERVTRLAGLFGIKRQVRAFTSQQISMPMTVGSLKPVIILPPDLAANLSQPEFESVIAHELAHIKRWDYLTNMLQRAVQAYLFFHPAVWFIGKQLLIERELACDDWAVKTCEPRRYASCLTKLVESLNQSTPHMAVRIAATGIIFGKHVISRRVEMILNRDRNATTAVSKPALLYSIGLVVMFVAVCSLISPVIAVPLGQKPAKQTSKEGKAATPAPARSQEYPPLPPLPPLPPEAELLIEPLDIPDIPEPLDAPLPPVIAALAPEAGLAPLPGDGIAGGVIAPVAEVAPLPPGAPQIAIVRGQDDRKREPAIPETELLNLLVDIVKRDADPNVRNEALQGIYRLRSDAATNALIQLYDGTTDVKVKSEIIGYLLRRESANSKVDNSKAIAKLTAIAKSEPNEELRNRAIRYLGNVKGDEGADTLIQIYDGLQDQKMKQYVIRSLAYNKSRKAVDKLIQIAKSDADPAVRQYAIRSLYNVDSQRYLELIDRERPRIGRLDREFFPTTPRVFEFNGKPFEFDARKWEEWQQNWQKNWEDHNGKLREMIEKLRIEGLDNLKFDDLQNKLRIELPKIELQIRDLEDKIRLGHEFERIGSVEGQLATQLAAVDAQLSSTRARNADADRKVAELRRLSRTLSRQLNSVRSMRTTAPRPAPRPAVIRSTNAAPVVTPKARAVTVAAPSSF